MVRRSAAGHSGGGSSPTPVALHTPTGFPSGRAGEAVDDGCDICSANRLVKRDPNVAVSVIPEVDSRRLRRRAHARGLVAPTRIDPERVEEGVIALGEAERREPVRQPARQAMNPPREPAQAFRSVPDGVHARDVREESLCRADVRRRPLTADVLLARLERHPVRRPSARIDRNAYQPPRHLPRMALLRREERRVRSATADRHTEALRAPDDDVSA